MKVVSSRQMKAIDRMTIETFGIPGAILMENAGQRIAEEILKRRPNLPGEKIVVVAGKGNNGGDGFVVARHLARCGGQPCVLLLAHRSDLRGDAAHNLAIAAKFGIEIREIAGPEAWARARSTLVQASIIVDAMFGTGLMKPADGLYAAAIKDINAARGFKVAVDIPSGLSSDTFQLIGPAVKADLTVTLAAPKVGLLFPPAEEYVGELVVGDICIPPALFDDERLTFELMEKADVAPYFRPRRKDTHKGTYGQALILAGSYGKTGAAVMAGRAALRMGAGLVTIGTPQSCLPIIARGMMELMTEPLPETGEGTLAEEALSRILSLCRGKDALLIGPGLSTHPSTARLIRALLPKILVPLVIDADGLNILAEDIDILTKLPHPPVLTPHPGEFARLTGLTIKEVLEHKLDLAPRFAERYGVTLVLKGHRTLIASPQGRVFINPTGNPGMATAGSGDVLGGMIVSFIAQEKDLVGATQSAVYLHGLCGDIAAARLSERALIAGDLIKTIPEAMKYMEA